MSLAKKERGIKWEKVFSENYCPGPVRKPRMLGGLFRYEPESGVALRNPFAAGSGRPTGTGVEGRAGCGPKRKAPSGEDAFLKPTLIKENREILFMVQN